MAESEKIMRFRLVDGVSIKKKLVTEVGPVNLSYFLKVFF